MSGMSQKPPLKLDDLDEITLNAGQAFLALGLFLRGYSDRTKDRETLQHYVQVLRLRVIRCRAIPRLCPTG